MSAYNDRWERQKRYLLRNFLVNPGFQLSPIPEERSSSRSSSRSSLPELVVEPEPDRHDESEDFYCELERRMKRYYRQLFLGEIVSDDEDSTEFDINQSMTSTFIMDNDNIEENDVSNAEEINTGSDKDVIINERILRDVTNANNDREMINEYQDVAFDVGLETHDMGQMSIDKSKEFVTIEDAAEDPRLVETRSGHFLITNLDSTNIDLNNENEGNQVETDNQSGSVKSHDDMDFIERDLNEMQCLSKSKSDTEDSIECHVTSTTVAQIHDIPVRVRQLAEDLSPVLLPRSVRVSRGVAAADDLMTTSESLRALQTFDEIMEKDSSDNVNMFEKHGATAQGPHKEIRRLLTISEVTKVSNESKDSEKMINVQTSRNKDDDEEENKSIVHQETYSDNQEVDENQRLENEILRTRHQQEETIGPDEFEYSKSGLGPSTESTDHQNVSNWDNNETDDSFENAVRRGLFETKNARKAGIESTDEEMESSSDDCEPVEEIRVPRDVGIRSSFRASVDAEDSPMLEFETQANAEKLEDISTDSNRMDASLNTEQAGEEHHTPSPLRSIVLNALDEIWSVSPVDIDIQELLNKPSYQGNDLEPDYAQDSPKDHARFQDDGKIIHLHVDANSKALTKDVTPPQDNKRTNSDVDYDIEETEKDITLSRNNERREESEEVNDELQDITQYTDDRTTVDSEVDDDIEESSKNDTSSQDSKTSTDLEVDVNIEELQNETISQHNTGNVDLDIDSDFEELTEDVSLPQYGSKNVISKPDVDKEKLPKEATRSHDKRKMSEIENIPSAKRKRKDMAIQTSLNKGTSRSDRPMSWNDIKADFFVGTPLVLKLCGCEDHICAKLAKTTN